MFVGCPVSGSASIYAVLFWPHPRTEIILFRVLLIFGDKKQSTGAKWLWWVFRCVGFVCLTKPCFTEMALGSGAVSWWIQDKGGQNVRAVPLIDNVPIHLFNHDENRDGRNSIYIALNFGLTTRTSFIFRKPWSGRFYAKCTHENVFKHRFFHSLFPG